MHGYANIIQLVWLIYEYFWICCLHTNAAVACDYKDYHQDSNHYHNLNEIKVSLIITFFSIRLCVCAIFVE